MISRKFNSNVWRLFLNIRAILAILLIGLSNFADNESSDIFIVTAVLLMNLFTFLVKVAHKISRCLTFGKMPNGHTDSFHQEYGHLELEGLYLETWIRLRSYRHAYPR